MPPTPRALPRPHLPSGTGGADGADAGSLRQRVASREESLLHRGGGTRRTWAPVGGSKLRWRCVLVCQSLGRSVCVRPQSPRPPRSRLMRPAPGALRLQPRRAPATAAARLLATLPLPLNSCAKYAALHLQGKPSGPDSRSGSRGPAQRTPAPRTTSRPCALFQFCVATSSPRAVLVTLRARGGRLTDLSSSVFPGCACSGQDTEARMPQYLSQDAGKVTTNRVLGRAGQRAILRRHATGGSVPSIFQVLIRLFLGK